MSKVVNIKSKKAAKVSPRERIRAKFSGGGGGDFANVLRPGDGEIIVRILPPKDPQDEFYIHRKQHIYNKRPVICPKTLSGRNSCAICDEYAEMKKVDEDQAGYLQARDVYFMNVVVVDKKSKKLGDEVQIFQLGKQAMKQVVDFYIDEDEAGDFWGNDAGRKGVAYDLKIEKTGKGLATRYTVKQVFKTSSLPTPQAILNAAHDLENSAQFAVPSSEEVEEIAGLGQPDVASSPKKGVKSKKAAPVEVDDDDDDDLDDDLDDEDDDEAPEVDADDDDEDEDDDDEDDDEDDDDDDADDDEDDDDEDDDDEDDDDEDDDEDDVDDDEEEEKSLKAASSKKPAKAPGKKAKTDTKALANMLKSGKRKSG